MAKTVKKLAVVGIGFFLLFLGVLGFILPVLPGIIILLIGVSLLNKELGWFERFHPHLDILLNKIKKYLQNPIL